MTHHDFVRRGELDALIASGALRVVESHQDKPDPHLPYATDERLDKAFARHSKEENAHTIYVKGADVDEKITAHAQEKNPHPDYALDEDITTALDNHEADHDYAKPDQVSAAIAGHAKMRKAHGVDLAALPSPEDMRQALRHTTAGDPHGDRDYADHLVESLGLHRAALTELSRTLERKISELDARIAALET